MEAHDITQALITRFNVQIRPGDDRNVSPAWLEPRMELFERICAPSVAGQTGRTRPWLIFLDARTPPAVLERIGTWRSVADVTLVELSGLLSDEDLRQRVRALLPQDRPWLLTSRLDNDDALADDYLDAVVAAASPGTGILVASRGYQLWGHRTYAARDDHSPFITMIEPNGQDILTAYCAPHRRARELFPSMILPRRGMWLQSIHGANMANSVSGVRVDNSRITGSFSHLELTPDVDDLAFRRDQASSFLRSLSMTAKRAAGRRLRHARTWRGRG